MYFIYFGNIIINFIGMTKKNGVKIFALSAVILAWALVAGDQASPDVINYINSYNSAPWVSFDLEIGYLTLEKIGNILGLDYQGFRLLIAVIPTLLIYNTVKKYSINPNFFYFYYLIYLVFMDAVQIRNYLAFSFVVYATRYLISDKSQDILKFILLILIATSFHTTSIFYMFLLLVNSKSKKYFVRYIVMIALIFSLLIFLNNNQIPFLGKILQLFSGDNERIERYLSTTTNFGFLVPFGLHSANLFLCMFSIKIYKEKANKVFGELKNDLNRYRKNEQYLNCCYWINLVTVILFPLFMININFYRISRNLIIVNLIGYSIAFTSLKKNVLNQFLFGLATLFVILLWFYYDFIFNNHFDSVLKRILENNLLL